MQARVAEIREKRPRLAGDRLQVAGRGGVQMGGALHQEMRGLAGEKERSSTMNGYVWGGGRKEEGKERSRKR